MTSLVRMIEFAKTFGIVTLCAGFLMSCATVENFVTGPEDDTAIRNAQTLGATKHRIFVATTRARSNDPSEVFSGLRSKIMTLGYLDVTVPPEHETGRIEKLKPGQKANPREHFLVSQPTLLTSTTSFQGNLNGALGLLPESDKNILVFVHGYNTSLGGAVLRLTQFVHDTGYKGIPILFSWASLGKPHGYVYDLNSALQSRDQLEALAHILRDTDTNQFDILAHSMGNLVTIEAMRNLVRIPDPDAESRLRNVILAHPDVDFDLFEAQFKSFHDKLKEQFTVLVSTDDRALGLSRRIAGGISRAGAAKPKRLEELGLNVIDLSEVDEKSSTNHTKFAAAPEIVRLIGRGFRSSTALSEQ